MLRWFLALFFVVTTTLTALGKEPYGLGIVDEPGRLDRVALEKAAQPLLSRGAAIAVVLVRHGGQQDAVKQLGQLGLLNGRQISTSGLYVYVSLEPHYSELRAGARFSDDLPASQLEQIRDQTLNPRLREELYQRGFANSLEELERKLSHNLSLNDKLRGATLALVVLGTFSLLGFWTWFWETPVGRGLDWLWSLTPMARARQRREKERGRLANLHLLQTRAHSLELARQSLKIWSRGHKVEFDKLEQEIAAVDIACHLILVPSLAANAVGHQRDHWRGDIERHLIPRAANAAAIEQFARRDSASSDNDANPRTHFGPRPIGKHKFDRFGFAPAIGGNSPANADGFGIG